ncbi:hypothetical protein [Paraburkholderia sp. CI3]|uniref:hypothetical protein n=1 Tax=Paraburkholderia sp. CI3 TaxID=2991060 RepID=UPI003D1EBA1B
MSATSNAAAASGTGDATSPAHEARPASSPDNGSPTPPHLEEPDASAAHQPKAATSSAPDLRGHLDQFSAILSKGLDLAEAGVSLGVTLISRVGAVAQQEIRERASNAAMHVGSMPGAAPAEPSPSAEGGAWPSASVTAPAQSAVPDDGGYAVTNRLALIPGSEVRVSFSVNNDSTTEPKKVSLRVEGFAGHMQGARFEADTLVVKPTQKTIAPVDFEKFVLQGTLPSDLPPDVYHGAVVVESGSELRIPVILVVGAT